MSIGGAWGKRKEEIRLGGIGARIEESRAWYVGNVAVYCQRRLRRLWKEKKKRRWYACCVNTAYR